MEKYVVGVVVIIFLIVFKSLNKKFNEKTEEIEIIKKSGLKPGIHFLDAEKGIEGASITTIPDAIWYSLVTLSSRIVNWEFILDSVWIHVGFCLDSCF